MIGISSQGSLGLEEVLVWLGGLGADDSVSEGRVALSYRTSGLMLSALSSGLGTVN